MLNKSKVSLEIGDSFTLRNDYGLHLHVIVAESSPDDSALLFLVFISSVDTQYRDPTTIIHVGEHSYITKESWVRYQSILILPRKDIEKRIVDYFGKVSPNLLVRIQDGIIKTDRINEPDKNLFHQWKMDKLYREL